MLKIPITWWISIFLVLGIAAVYWPVIGYGFTGFDDPDYVWANPHVAAGLSWPGLVWAFTTFAADNWHPLTWLSHMLDVQLYGMHAGGHHATNVLFHAANTVLLFLLLKRLTGATWRSAFVAALFGWHPLHVESVAWVAERKDVLSTFFFLLTLGAYVRYAQRRSTDPTLDSGPWTLNFGPWTLNFEPWTLNFEPWTLNYSVALLFFALGLLSKPMLVTLPFVLLLLDYWPLGRVTNDGRAALPRRRTDTTKWRLTRLLLEKLPFFALSAASCVITTVAQAQGGAIKAMSVCPFDLRVQNAIISYVIYLEKMFWPTSLAVFYPCFPLDPDTMATAAFVLLLISGGVIILFRRRPYLAVGWLWFFGTLIPVIGLVQVGGQSMADRYTYVPLIGIFIAITWGVGDILSGWRYHRVLLAIAGAAVLGICLTLTAGQVRTWQNTETLARHALVVTSSNNGNMQVLLGQALIDQGRDDEASQYFADALSIRANDYLAQEGLAMARADQGKTREAIEAYRVAIELRPFEARSHFMLGNLLSQQGNVAEAIAEYRITLQLEPNHLIALNDLAWLLATAPDARVRDGAEAVRLAEKACQLTGYRGSSFVGTLAAAYAEAGRFDDAVKTAQQAVALGTAEKKAALADKNRKLLELYRAQKAYHEPALH